MLLPNNEDERWVSVTTKRYPAGAWLPIPVGVNDPPIIPVGVVLHVDAGNSSSLRKWFSGPSKGIESHGFIKRNGAFEQYRAFDLEADAQMAGNSWVFDGKRYGFISIETQGFGPGWWTPAQKASIKAFLSWASEDMGFPLIVVRTPQPISALTGGVGYHRQFKSWNPNGHSCPGPRRVAQFTNRLVPWMAEQRLGPALYTARPGDTFASVAGAHNMTPARLWALNRPHIKVGEKLRLR